MNALNGNVSALAVFHQRYVMEVAGDAVGLIIQERGGFRFFSSNALLSSLDRRLFTTARQAEDACRRTLTLSAGMSRAPYTAPEAWASAQVGG